MFQLCTAWRCSVIQVRRSTRDYVRYMLQPIRKLHAIHVHNVMHTKATVHPHENYISKSRPFDLLRSQNRPRNQRHSKKSIIMSAASSSWPVRLCTAPSITMHRDFGCRSTAAYLRRAACLSVEGGTYSSLPDIIHSVGIFTISPSRSCDHQRCYERYKAELTPDHHGRSTGVRFPRQSSALWPAANECHPLNFGVLVVSARNRTQRTLACPGTAPCRLANAQTLASDIGMGLYTVVLRCSRAYIRVQLQSICGQCSGPIVLDDLILWNFLAADPHVLTRRERTTMWDGPTRIIHVRFIVAQMTVRLHTYTHAGNNPMSTEPGNRPAAAAQ